MAHLLMLYCVETFYFKNLSKELCCNKFNEEDFGKWYLKKY